MLTQPFAVVRYSAANAFADMRAIYTWKSWTFGWLLRMLAQVTFFALIGKLIAQPGQTRFLVIGNSLMTCVVEAMMVVASSTWEVDEGTMPLLLAAPVRLVWVFAGRSLQWLISGAGTSLVSLFVLAPLFGVSWSAAQAAAVAVIVPVTGATTYCFGLFLAAFVLRVPDIRNIVSNVAYLLMMSFCGVEVPVGFWPRPVALLADTLPVTHALGALRAVAAGRAVGTVAAEAAAAVGVGAVWFCGAYVAFLVLARSAGRSGAVDFGSV